MKKATLGFILVTVIIDIIGMGLIIPIVPDLIHELTRLDTSGSALFAGFLAATYAISISSSFITIFLSSFIP